MGTLIERTVRTWMATQREEELVLIAQGLIRDLLGFLESNSRLADIEGGKATLLELVKALGEYLTAEDGESRVKGLF